MSYSLIYGLKKPSEKNDGYESEIVIPAIDKSVVINWSKSASVTEVLVTINNSISEQFYTWYNETGDTEDNLQKLKCTTSGMDGIKKLMEQEKFKDIRYWKVCEFNLDNSNISKVETRRSLASNLGGKIDPLMDVSRDWVSPVNVGGGRGTPEWFWDGSNTIVEKYLAQFAPPEPTHEHWVVEGHETSKQEFESYGTSHPSLVFTTIEDGEDTHHIYF